jgi:hypothetical protein
MQLQWAIGLSASRLIVKGRSAFRNQFQKAAAFQIQNSQSAVVSLTGPSAVPYHPQESRAGAKGAKAAFISTMVNHHYPKPTCAAGRSRPGQCLPLPLGSSAFT